MSEEQVHEFMLMLPELLKAPLIPRTEPPEPLELTKEEERDIKEVMDDFREHDRWHRSIRLFLVNVDTLGLIR